MDESLRLLLATAEFGRHVTDEVARLLGDTPLNNFGILVCAELAVNGEQRVKELAEATGVTSGRVAQISKELTESSIVNARRDPEDGRATLLRLTDKGQDLIRQTSLAMSKAMTEDPAPVLEYMAVLQETLESSLGLPET